MNIENTFDTEADTVAIDITILMDAVDTLEFADLKALKDKVDAAVKARKEEAVVAEKAAKIAAKEAALESATDLVVGMVVQFNYKGTVKTGTIVKITDKTFHINRGEAGLDGDASKSAYIGFDKRVL